MKNVLKLIPFGLSLIVIAFLITVLVFVMSAVSRAVFSQTESLDELQGEYVERDIAMLDGESVSGAEAVSLARKYRDKAVIYKNGTALGAGAVITRDLFKDNTNWITEIKLDSNGELTSINFRSPSGVVSEPTTANEAKNFITGIIGGSATADWSTIGSTLASLKNGDKYRSQLATLLSMPATSDWSSVYTSIADRLSGMSSSGMVSCEKFSLLASGSFTYSMSSPLFCYINSGAMSGVIVFSGSGYVIRGDFDIDDISVNVASKTIISHLPYNVSCIMISS